MRALPVGTPVQVDYGLASTSPVPFVFALGAHTLLSGHRPLPGLDDRTAQPRSAVGIANHGHTLRLLSTDGREGTGSGLTLRELAEVLDRLGCDQGVSLDGGGSATLVTRDPTSSLAVVRNSLADARQRPVPNGIAIHVGPAPPSMPPGPPQQSVPDRPPPAPTGWVVSGVCARDPGPARPADLDPFPVRGR